MTVRVRSLMVFVAVVGAITARGDDVTVTSAVDPSTGSVLQSRTIRIYLRANKPDVTLSNIRLLPNEPLRSIRPDLNSSPIPFENLTNASEKEEIHLSVNTKTELHFQYRPQSFWSPLSSWSLIAMEPGLQKFTFHYDVKPPVAGPAIGSSEPVDVMITAASLSVIVGGAVGAFALASLILIIRLRKDDKLKLWRVELLEVIVATCAGALIAAILIFLGELLKDAHLGVQIAATSWKGGVIIGLFSYKLADILTQKLSDHPVASRPIQDHAAGPD